MSNVYINELKGEVDLKDDYTQLQNMIQRITWVIQAVSMKQQIEEDHEPLSYGELKLAVERMKEVGLREDIGLCKHVKLWHSKAEKAREEFVERYEYLRNRPPLSGTASVNAKKMSQRQKPTIYEARRILDLLRDVEEFVKLTQEVETVSQDLRRFESWASKIQGACDQYNSLLDLSGKGQEQQLREKKDVIVREIEGLRREGVELYIRSEEYLEELRILEWRLHAVLVLKKVRKDSTSEVVKDLLKEGEQLLRENGSNEKVLSLVEALQKEASGSEKVKAFVENIRKIEQGIEHQKVSYEALLTAMDEITGKKGSLLEESKILESLYLRYEEIQDSVKRLLQPQQKKGSLANLTKLQQTIKKFPIAMDDEYQQLEAGINAANDLMAELKETLFPEYEDMEHLIAKYKQCPIFVKQADELEKTFDEIKSAYGKITTQGRKLASGECRASFEELSDLSLKIDKVQGYKNEDLLRKLKKDFFIKMVEMLQGQSSQPREASGLTISIPSRTLKDMAMEVINLKNEFRKESQLPLLEEIRKFMESQVKIAEDTAQEIKSIKDSATLDRLPAVKGFVDFTPEIVEKRAELTALAAAVAAAQTQAIRNIDYHTDNEDLGKRDQGKLTKKKRGRLTGEEEFTVAKERERNDGKDSREGSRMSKDDEREHEKKKDVIRRRVSPTKSQGREREREKTVKKDGDRERLKSKSNTLPFTLKENVNPNKKANNDSRESSLKGFEWLKAEKKDKPKEGLTLSKIGGSQTTVKASGDYVTSAKQKVSTKEREQAFPKLTKLLESSHSLNLSQSDCSRYARLLMQSFPEVIKSAQSLNFISERLRNVLGYKYIAKNIVEKWFDKQYLRKLFEMDMNVLMTTDRKLKEASIREAEAAKADDFDFEQNITIKKKPKLQNSSQLELTRLLPSASAPSVETKKSTWASLGFKKEKKSPTESKNPLKDLLRKTDTINSTFIPLQ